MSFGRLLAGSSESFAAPSSAVCSETSSPGAAFANGTHIKELQRLITANRTGDARVLARHLCDSHLNSADEYLLLGTALVRLGRYDEALAAYDQAGCMQPENSTVWFNKATVQRFLGRPQEAETCCQRAIELNPTDSEAYLLRSDLRSQSPANNHIEELKSLIDSGVLSVHGIVQVSYALAKELDDVGAYDLAFASFRRAADLRRKHLKYDISDDISTIRRIMEVYTSDKLQNGTFGFDSEQPIFIVGLPRCGSTLVERILASHRAITSVGESNNFVIEMMKLISNSGGGGRHSLVERSAELRFKVLGERYVDSTRPVETDSEFFIDKMPLNFLYIGLIALALPSAKILHVRRNPMDCCFAMYRCLFRHAYPFSYNFKELAQYYAAYDKLMQHWHRVLPGKIHDVFYEDLVHDLRGQAGEILRYCQLPWDEECLAYHENDAGSETASATQVRRPIYRNSVDKWRNYGEQLTELHRFLTENGIAVA